MVSSLNHRWGAIRLDGLQSGHGYGPGAPATSPSWPTRCAPWRWTGGGAPSAPAPSASARTWLRPHRAAIPRATARRVRHLRAGAWAVHPVRRPARRPCALPVLRAVTDPHAQGGGYYGPGGLGQGRGSSRKVHCAKTAYDEQLAGRLWQASETLTGVTFPSLPGPAKPPSTDQPAMTVAGGHGGHRTWRPMVMARAWIRSVRSPVRLTCR